jgi:Fuc2NAc and GlcNAc transferase
VTLAVVLVALVSSGAGWIVTRVVRNYAVRKGVLDRPNPRSSHSAPMPRGGGVAVIVATLLGIAIAVATNLTDARDALILATGLAAVGAVGWMDDTRTVRPIIRLAVHTGAALWTMWMLGGLPAISFGTYVVDIGPVGYVIGVLGIVWSINLFNFMDGIDGLAGSEALLVFGIGALLLFACGDRSLGAISTAAAAAAFAFLTWNWPPAKIFLGDVGSGALGYLVAALAITSEDRHSVPLLAFAMISGLFLADATVTLVRRLIRGENAAEAHRDHAYQRLARTLGSHRAVTTRAMLVTIILGVLAAAGTLVPPLLLPLACAACVLLASLLWSIERSAPMRSRLRP